MWVSICSGNGLEPNRRQAITWNNADVLSIGPLGTNFSDNWIEILIFSCMKTHLKMSSAKCLPFCPGGDELHINVPILVIYVVLFLFAIKVYGKRWHTQTQAHSDTFILVIHMRNNIVLHGLYWDFKCYFGRYNDYCTAGDDPVI